LKEKLQKLEKKINKSEKNSEGLESFDGHEDSFSCSESDIIDESEILELEKLNHTKNNDEFSLMSDSKNPPFYLKAMVRAVTVLNL
jgi:hypothetical protein